MAADPSRLVDVRGVHPPDAAGRVYEELGSGLLVTDDLVLTAAHVVFDADGPMPVEASLPGSAAPLAGEVVWPLPRGDVDVALVRVTGAHHLPDRGRSPRWGRFTTSRTGQCVDAAGFPAVLKEGPSRVSYQLVGHLNPQGAQGLGRHLVSVEDPPADPGPGRPSPWEGMSGAAVFCGPVLVGVIVIDTPGFARDLLTAVPADTVLTDPMARELLGLDAGARSVELEPLMVRAAGLQRPASPAQLVRAEQGVISFVGRSRELRQLEAWCLSPAEFGAQVIVGPGGRGKTRLAQFLVARATSIDEELLAGFLSAMPTTQADFEPLMSVLRRHRVVLVVDYAESRGPQLEAILAAYESAGSPPRIRLLLLARDDGDWWSRLRDRHPDLLGEVDVAALGPLHDRRDREAEFRACVDQFARRLPEIDSRVDWLRVAATVEPEGLADPRFGDPLALQLKALLALLDRGPQPGGLRLEERIIAHERDYWRRTLEAEGLELSARMRDHAVAAATLIGVATRPAAMQLLQRIPELTQHSRVADWLRSLYPTEATTRYFGPLQPDRIGEHLVGRVTQDEPTLLSHLLASDDVAELEEALIVLGRAIPHQPHLVDQLGDLVSSGGPALTAAMDGAVERISDPLPLLRLLPERLSPGRFTVDPDDYGSSSSWGHQSSVPERLDDLARDVGGNPFTSSAPPPPPVLPGGAPPGAWPWAGEREAAGREHERLATVAYEAGNLVLASHEFARAADVYEKAGLDEPLTRALLAQASVLSDARSFEAAARTIDHAVSLVRGQFGSGRLDSGVLGRALDVQAGILAEMGDLERALASQQEAWTRLRDHEREEGTPAATRDLVRALSNLAALTQRTGRTGEAMRHSAEAVDLLATIRDTLAPGDATAGRILLQHAQTTATVEGPEPAERWARRALEELHRTAELGAQP
ncbi:S1 family peptidase, partial [Nostocoides japonicum]|uniref:S1 family peptidase n=1 Tax=Nostocoides japonicum TaxID=99481 RepID=UPI00065BA9B3